MTLKVCYDRDASKAPHSMIQSLSMNAHVVHLGDSLRRQAAFVTNARAARLRRNKISRTRRTLAPARAHGAKVGASLRHMAHRHARNAPKVTFLHQTVHLLAPSVSTPARTRPRLELQSAAFAKKVSTQFARATSHRLSAIVVRNPPGWRVKAGI